ncbi:MAG: hypothetical protein RMJ98_02990 [Myxococcales bacterium]|nr:hypothetical protein [Polyangiaceae bacterium]MDW8248256.1 hypothetical protein [Myxococcales bacterium]
MPKRRPGVDEARALLASLEPSTLGSRARRSQAAAILAPLMHRGGAHRRLHEVAFRLDWPLPPL